MPESKPIVIGGAAGAWGDSSFAAPQLLDAGVCDYLIFEALAEITMAILTRQHARDPARGYATDVIRMIGDALPRLAADGVRVVTNAGGVNPRAAADELRRRAKASGVALRVGVVEGDDLMAQREALSARGLAPSAGDATISFNAYLGARPIAAALAAGADVVVTGRCVDSALTLGPLLYEHGWTARDLDALAQGSLAGHLLECGPQATGGLLTDVDDVPRWEDIGYPVAECAADGSFVLTKPRGTGGLVDERTVAEQLLYEIGDPARYELPDVTCDWREVRLEQVGVDRVRVTGARGRAAPERLKACAQVADGWRVTTLLFLAGRDAPAKGRRLGAEALSRVGRLLERHGFAPLRAHEVEVLGAESTYGPFARASPREVVVRIALHHDSREALGRAVRELPSFGLAVPGLSGGGAGLAKPTPLIRLESFLVPRDAARARVHVDDAAVELRRTEHAAPARAPSGPGASEAPPSDVGPLPSPAKTARAPLFAFAHARSGDKGPHANIGVRARSPDFFPWLCHALTAERVQARFAHRGCAAVRRFTLPGIDALNFLLEDALGGGGIASLRVDPQGKAYAQQLLDLELDVPAEWLAHPAARLSG